jgi:hypothetical protein
MWEELSLAGTRLCAVEWSPVGLACTPNCCCWGFDNYVVLAVIGASSSKRVWGWL